MIYIKKKSTHYKVKNNPHKTTSLLAVNVFKHNTKKICNEELQKIENFTNEKNFDVLHLLTTTSMLKTVFITGTLIDEKGVGKYFTIIDVTAFKFDGKVFSFFSNNIKIHVNWLCPHKNYISKDSCDLLYLLEMFSLNKKSWKNLHVCNILKKIPIKYPIKCLINTTFIKILIETIGYSTKSQIMKSIYRYYNLIKTNPTLLSNLNLLTLYRKFEKHFNDKNNFTFFKFPPELSYYKESCNDDSIMKKFKFLKRIINTNPKRQFITNDTLDQLTYKWKKTPIYTNIYSMNPNIVCMAIKKKGKCVILLDTQLNNLLKIDQYDCTGIDEITYLKLIIKS